MLRHPQYTRTRINQLVNRLQAQIYPQTRPVSDLTVSGPTARISFADAQKLDGFRKAEPGTQFSPAWATFWFRAQAAIPKEWAGQRVDILWDSQSEATLWLDGKVAQGLNMTQGDRPDAILVDAAQGGETLSFQIEMACNHLGGVSDTPSAISPFHLRRCDIARFDRQAWDLYFDAYVLTKLETEIAKDQAGSEKSWGGLLLSELNRFCNLIDPEDRATWPKAWEILTALYQNPSAGRQLNLSAIGHAHIDTAWLWPLAETERKCERSFGSAIAYMRDYPEYRFACSQAAQYEIVKRRNPELYARITSAVKAGQFIPVGGTWVEPDCNIPSGESLCRQFLYGQTFFQKEFGARCKEFWNPDVFGYNGQLPQIMRLAGIERFLTQKLSWNRFNKPIHHTFTWEGIDGSQVLAHFPPGDTYNTFAPYDGRSEITWLREHASLFKDHDRSHHGFLLYGFGDGGGGPTKPMLEVLRRVTNLQGVPPTVQRSSDEFFTLLDADIQDRPVIIGELYFEYHRGTYTSQARTKRHNRQTEVLLHDAEFLWSLAKLNGRHYPKDDLDSLWKTLLLNQFHDILPGSSIAAVYKDSEQQFADARKQGDALVVAATGAGHVPLNTTGLWRSEVVENAGKLQFIDALPFSAGKAHKPASGVTTTIQDDHIILENANLRAVFAMTGRLLSLIEKDSHREALLGEANVLELYDDHPTEFDAWDVDPFHLETRQLVAGAKFHEVVRRDDLRGEVRFEYAVGESSSLRQIVRLDAGSRRLEFICHADWHESHKILKVAHVLNVRALNATYEMQFGYVERPTHFNNSFDLARYEVPMHRWCDLSEHGFGVAMLNDCKYGGSTFGNTMRLTLLRAPKSPDPTCDMGTHDFSFALLPHIGSWREARVVAEAIRFNTPFRFGAALPGPEKLATITDANLIIDTVKLAESGAAIVVRLYECHGARGRARMQVSKGFFTGAHLCNVLEDTLDALPITSDGVDIEYRPHQIISVLLHLAH